MKKRFLCLALMLVMLVGIIPFSAVTAFAADPKSPQSKDVETVTVTTFDELRSALSADGDATIVLANDISVRDPEFEYWIMDSRTDRSKLDIPSGATVYTYNYDYDLDDVAKRIADIFSIDVVGTKTLDLNGHDIFAYLHEVTVKNIYNYSNPSPSEKIVTIYDATLFTVKRGATLNLDDTSSGTPGNIFFDSYMYDTIGEGIAAEAEYLKETVHNIFEVYGTLNVFNGIIEAGRSKEQWIYDGVKDPNEWILNGFEDYCDAIKGEGVDNVYNNYARQQIWGSAVTVYSGGVFNSYGGTYYGRGEGYRNFSEQDFGRGCVVSSSKNNGDGYTYTSDDKPGTGGHYDQNYERDEVIEVYQGATVNIYGGYFEGKGGAKVFAGDVTGVVVFDGEFKNSKVDAVRCIDARASNDLLLENDSVFFYEIRTPVVITGSCGTIGLNESAYKDWSESGLGIKNAFVNGEARTDGEIVPVKLKDGTASIKFEWNGLSENFEKAGCKLYPVVQYYLDETKGLHPYEVVDNSAIITTPLSYEGQKSTFKFDLYLLMPNGKQTKIGSHTVVVSVEKEEIERVSISLDTLVGGTTPANYEGKVNTTGVSIAEEAWYEYNDGSLKKMNDSDKFVAGNQYVYGVTFAFDSGYKFNPFTTVSINGIAARKSGDYFHW